MKKIIVLILLVGILFDAPVVSAESVSGVDRNLILTDGMAEVSGENDCGKIVIGVVTQGRLLNSVSAENRDITGNVLAAIKSLNIAYLTIKTIDYRVTPQRDYKAKPPQIKGYEVHNGVAVTLEGGTPDALSRDASLIVSKALEAGANTINDIRFYIKDKTLLECKAITMATRQAILRAETLADAAHVKLKRIVSLSTSPIHTPPIQNMLRGAMVQAASEAMEPPMEPGESRIRVQVSLAYEIE